MGQHLPGWEFKSRQTKTALKLLHGWHFRTMAKAIAGHYWRDIEKYPRYIMAIEPAQ
jgi:hypothetical protein